MHAVALLSVVGPGMLSRGASSLTDAQKTFDGLIVEARANGDSGVLPDPLSEADPEELEAHAAASDALDELETQDSPESPDLPLTSEDGPVPTDIVEPQDMAIHAQAQKPMLGFETLDSLTVDDETTPVPSVFETSAVDFQTDGVPSTVGGETIAPIRVPSQNSENEIVINGSENTSDKVGVESDFDRSGNALSSRSIELPVQMENGIEIGEVTTEPNKMPTDSHEDAVLNTSTRSASPSEPAVDQKRDDTAANTRVLPSGPLKVSETDASLLVTSILSTLPSEPAVDPIKGGMPANMRPVAIETSILSNAPNDGSASAVPDLSVQTDALFEVPEAPAGPNALKNLTPLGPVATDGALPEPQPPEVLPLSDAAKDIGFDLTVDHARPSAIAEADAQTAFERAADPVRPRSAIVPNVVERVAALPREVGETVIHLKPHGMGLIEVSIQQARDGGLDIVLRVQNPLVLEAMQAERQVVAQAIGGQGGAASGSLTMDLFQSGSGQRGAQGDGSGGTARSGSFPTTDESLEDAAGQIMTRQIIQSDRVNITT